MASRCRSISRPAISLLKSAMKKPSRPATPTIPASSPRSPSFPRVPREMASLQSMLPYHSAVSSARLTSRLGIGSLRSLSQELGLSVPR